ncbi:MAG: transglycosylase domain-containing protein [Proteobacteria bacterium]|nr:transglycosylase domain-containing protein [Pseudomonadota bacterium]
MKRPSFVILRHGLRVLAMLPLLVVLGVAGVYVFISPSLPSADAMRKVELQVPLRVYTRTGGVISQIGEQRRIPVTYDQIPELVRNAVLAAEDDRFFSHHGIDWTGVLRAVVVNVVSADRAQGASTITMQAARNMFLSLDKTWRRKLQEVFVTYRMERDFTKQEILSTYLNVIFFGQRSYGVAAAAETYFGKSLSQLSVSEAATLAGIVQVPSRYNPMTNPAAATTRRNYVLRRMTELGYIDIETARTAHAERIVARSYAPVFDAEAPYVAELARQEIVNRYGPAAVNYGYKVFTTLDGRLQTAANRALRLGLIEYDRRHGYRGPLAKANLPPNADAAAIESTLDGRDNIGLLEPAVVLSTSGTTARVHVRGSGTAQIEWSGMSWARRITKGQPGGFPRQASDVMARGDIILVVADHRGSALLAQVPEAQSALVALDPLDGAVVSLVGGFDYYSNQFNRVTQAKRQPGSGFKPFLYSAALENGFTPSSIILDAPIVLDDASVEGGWRPENSGGDFSGPLRLREALVKSRNLVSIRLLRDIGLPAFTDYAARFGFEKAALPQNLTLALGTLSATPLQMATGFATFANGGYKVSPYLIDRIENAAGEVLFQATPAVVCSSCDDASVPPPPLGPQRLPEGTTLPEGQTIAGLLPPLDPVPSAEQAAARVADAPVRLRALASVQGGQGALKSEHIAPRVISAQNAWLMRDILADVIKRGTGRRALALGRTDLSGKTGTTQEARDTWFNGFNSTLVATVWVGYDEERPLGEGEEGARTAVPIWVYFMREALRGVPQAAQARPPGLVDVLISSRTGAMTDDSDVDGIREVFIEDRLPTGAEPTTPDHVPARPPQPGAGEGLF